MVKWPKRQYKVSGYTGSAEQDVRLLNHIQTSLMDLVSTYDTLNGIHIKFEKDARYQALIDVLDIIKHQKSISYRLSEQGIRAWYEIPEWPAPNEIRPFLLCGTGMEEAKLLDEKRQKAALRTLESSCYQIAQSLWASAVLWTVLFVLAITKHCTNTNRSRRG